ncbi:MAG: hypothetical protein FWG39_02015 [Alphaproteobacteria bacterium]|nr:hypothetical protein [Alphaproteobacteria bacterium]
MKIITMCGSLRFESEIRYWSERLELEGNCVLSIIYPTADDKDAYTPEQHELLDIMHKKRIDISDAVFIVNKNGYIGSSTKDEIEYAKSIGKEILFLEN